MRFVGWQDDHFAGPDREWDTGNSNPGLPVRDREDCIEGGGVFGKPLTGIEREEGDGAGLLEDNHPACHRTVLVLEEVVCHEDFANKLLALRIPCESVMRLFCQ